MRQMVHPARILDERGARDLPPVEAVYGLTEGVSSRMVGKYVAAALKRVPKLPEWQDAAFLARNGFAAFGRLNALHRPATRPMATEEARALAGAAAARL